MRRSFLFAVSLLAAALALAATRPLYRIDLKDGGHFFFFSKDRPTHRGSVLLFHAYPAGTLTGLPEEAVVTITPVAQAAADQVTATRPRPLEPGEVIYLGPTAGDQALSAPRSGTAAPGGQPAIPGGVYDPRNPAFAYGYAPPRNATMGAGNLPTGVLTGDTARAVSGPPPTVEVPFGSDGFPNTTGAATPAIGPDGQPILIPAGAPGSMPPTIGPNGMPILAPSGSPGSATPVIGPDGTPVLAPPGAPGSAPPVIGPNGTPILAPPGAPGSTSPPVGPNGYPVPPK